MEDGVVGLTIGGGAFVSNSATESGGGMFLSSGCNSTTLRGVEFIGNSAPLGGGLCTRSMHNLRLLGGSLTSNSAFRGGGLFGEDLHDVEISDLLASGNSAVGGVSNEEEVGEVMGGALSLLRSSAIALLSSQFRSNTAVDRGGAVSAVAVTDLVVGNCSFVGNQQTSRKVTGIGGGALYYDECDGDLRVSEGMFSENEAGVRGSAIYSVATYTILVDKTAFADNIVHNYGGK